MLEASSAGTYSGSPAISDALLRLEAGHPVTLADAEALFAARGPELERLLAVASAMRDDGLERSGRAGVITYSRKVFIPVTYLCRDRCHYCIFVETPGGLALHGKPVFMSPDEILDVARRGAELGCKEALFTLGDRPEDRWPVARAWLDEHGYESTIDYIRAMAQLVLEETGLLPHLNPGVMSWSELQKLRPFAPSMGMMLETTATRLWSEKGGVHYGSPDKDPALRLRVLEDAGRSRVPFTTGVLLGIGENDAERADALFAIRASHERWGHIQETIVQNFRAKPRTAMQNEADLAVEEYIAAVAVARVVMGPDATIQAPPNLTDAHELGLLIRAGIDDWGGVSPLTADHVNPERPWPDLDDLARLTAASGFELRERLTAHPQYITGGGDWIDPRLRGSVDAVAAPSGLADESAPVSGRPWGILSAQAPAALPTTASRSSAVETALQAASIDPAGLSDEGYSALLKARGEQLDALCQLADELRLRTVGDGVTYVVNRNLDSALLRDEPADGALTLESAADLAGEAWELGATELCIQGEIPAATRADQLDLVRAIHARAPQLHLHAFRPAELAAGARRRGVPLREYLGDLREAGLGSVPGTAARILDESVRAALTGGADISVAAWTDGIVAAHESRLRSTATMIYGHIETPQQIVAHLRALRSIQDRTGGFSEFIAMPFVPQDSPVVVEGLVRSGPTLDESRAVHAVARLLLHGSIPHIQVAWTKLGLRASQLILQGGADDLGGLLHDGALRPDAGADAYRTLTISEVERLADEIGRTARQRTTLYGEPPVERLAAARRPRGGTASSRSRRMLPVVERESGSR